MIAGAQAYYCPRSYGLWFDEGELELAKDTKDRNLRWLDIDLWKHEEQFHISPGRKLSPRTSLPMYEVRYGESAVKVDVCSISQGVWLDRGEFIEIIHYLQEKEVYEMMHGYMKNVLEEGWEIFSGPELLRDEVLDLLCVLKLLQYKFIVQHPVISRFVLSLPT